MQSWVLQMKNEQQICLALDKYKAERDKAKTALDDALAWQKIAITGQNSMLLTEQNKAISLIEKELAFATFRVQFVEWLLKD